ncbi:MAG TPA: peptidyl-prolyl cis-trans isomerase [Candidatus Eisenbacteria bacterium]|jgi:parvulin-like peptidyl-prolyl isomerase
MSPRGLKLATLAVPLALAFATPSHPAPPRAWKPPSQRPGAPAESAAAAPAKRRPVRWINDQPDTGQFLPDTVLLARVNDRVIRVRDYVAAYFRAYAPDRPLPDSAGRIQFLNSMINKDVLGLMALQINRPLSFEDRAALREHRQRVLSNALFQRSVADSAIVSEDEVRRLYDQLGYALHLRHIQFADHATAERVQRELAAGRVRWEDAVRMHSAAPDSDRAKGGDLGWRIRLGFDPALAAAVFALKPREISPLFQDGRFYQLFQALERRPQPAARYESVRPGLWDEVRSRKVAQRGAAVQALLRDEIGMTYDSTNILWASSHFSPSVTMGREGNASSLEVNADLPEFTPADTARVLARHRYGHLTLGGFLESYEAIPPMVRPSVNDFESMRTHVDAIVLEPHRADMAVRRGLERDSLVVAQLEEKREQILVEHLYADSIGSKVWIRPEERPKYYQEHLASFFTFPRVKYAAFARDSRADAESLAARLRAGEKAEAFLRTDSLLGRITGSIQERSANDHGTAYYKLLFEELRPGGVSVEGPDRRGDYAVIQLLSYDPGRQLSYQEVESVIDESLQNLRAEELLKEFLARHRKRYRIVARPELLGRVAMVE